MNIKSLQKFAPWIAVTIGLMFVAYNTILLQDPTYSNAGVSTYFAAGILFIGTGVAFVVNKKLGMRFFIILTWLVTIYACYILLLATAALANPFFILPVLTNPMRLITYGAQVSFLVGLLLYLHTTRLQLKGKLAQDGGIKVAAAGLAIICLSLTPIVASVIKSGVLTGGPTYTHESKELASYLDDKYGQPFTVTETATEKRWRHSFDGWTELVATAHPVNNTAISFEVRGCIERCNGDNSKTDTYMQQAWAYELQPSIKNILTSAYQSTPEFEVDVMIPVDLRDQVATKPLPSVKKYIGAPVEPTINVVVVEPGYFTKENVADRESKVRAAATELKALGFKKFSLRHTMKNPEPPATYSLPSGVERSDVTCTEGLGITSEKYDTLQAAVNLKETFGKGCSYSTDEVRGGGIVKAVYPE
ncbi:MAG: hypothetical protein UY35_C0010G0015 [Candidatus Saccharibacteria bacterium GW2011_GWC2_48_9]|nr:MAG: hypothetical protein UY35_C0010G0015 [Candidatus Saccharibacteria bacterium GW2011_GWC2_48_9]HCH34019.1 hypothetical protein [Candidatus Saccharibacteria bacterium]